MADNRFIFLISLLLAFVLWCLVTAFASSEITRTVTNVPVQINLEGTTPGLLGLQTFGDADYTVDVTVTGPKYQLNERTFNANSLTVTANVSYVDSAGDKQLTLTPRVNDNSLDVKIDSYTPSGISVYFDTLRQTEFTIEPEILFPDGVEEVPEGYILDNPIISVSTTTVSGPASEITKIKRVVARVQVDDSLTATTTLAAELLMLEEDGSTPDYCRFDAEDVTVTLPVLKTKTLPVSVSYLNQPVAYLTSPLASTITPSTVRVALPADTADGMTTLNIGMVDFADINNTTNTFTVKTAEIEDVKFLDASLESITVRVNASAMTKTTYSVTPANVTSVNLPEGVTVAYDTAAAVEVTVIGPQSSLDSLTAAGIYAEVDYANIELENGKQQVEAHFYVKTLTDCWCYGKYTLTATVSGVTEQTADTET